jgi:hypothetical protein
MLRNYLSRLIAAVGGQSAPPSHPAEEHHAVRGFSVSVINERPEINTADALLRLEAALDLIAKYTPRRFRRLSYDLAGFWVRRFPCRAAFYSEPRACLVELTFLVNPRHTAAEVAASIVHEGVHARVARSGAVAPGADAKAREERLCRQAELEFGLALNDEPGRAVVLERARQSLLLADQEVAPSIDWSLAAQRVAEADRASRGGGQA